MAIDQFARPDRKPMRSKQRHLARLHAEDNERAELEACRQACREIRAAADRSDPLDPQAQRLLANKAVHLATNALRRGGAR